MQRHILPFVLVLSALTLGRAPVRGVPAYPRPVRITQSDGSQLLVHIVGDERYHYFLSEEGSTLTGGADGDLYYASRNAEGRLVPTQVKARPVGALSAGERALVAKLGPGLKPTYVRTMERPARLQSPATPDEAAAAEGKPSAPRRISSATTVGKLRSLILLVEFPDRTFVSGSAQQDFHDLLMQDNYSVNGATGSAWNYYHDNSNGRFDPEFVVAGPYRASREAAYYAGSDGTDNTPELIVETCRLADDEIDFSQFADDGVIRDVFVFYAGHNQAETADPQTIWPHRWDVQGDPRYRDVLLDGVQLAGYACSSELNADRVMAGIGTFCHEFGHVLGWPDFYDTDYAGSGGNAPALESYSLMCSGSYNNDGRTPPALNILERWMVGWAEPEEIADGGDLELGPVTNDEGYLVRTPTDNDYFLLESRDPAGNKWDRHIPDVGEGGMLVYHVDYTPAYVSRWHTGNSLNCNPGHECMKLVRSVPSSYGTQSAGRTFFPGTDDVRSLSPGSNRHYVSWKNEAPGAALGEIERSGGHIRMKARKTAALEITAEARQYDALLTWDGAPESEWKVSWSRSGRTEGERTVCGNALHIGGLLPAMTYSATVTLLSDESSSSRTLSFTTSPISTQNGVHIAVPADGFSHDRPVALSVLDYPRRMESVAWYIDGERTEETYVTLPAGEHRLTAVVTEAESGSEQYLIKYITVK